MLNKKTLTVISLRDIFDYVGFRSLEIEGILDYGFNSVTYGDASYTLIPGWSAIDRIWQGLDAFYDELESMGGDNPSRMIPAKIYTEKEIRDILSVVVKDTDYVDLEG